MTDRDHFAAAALTGLLSNEANQYPTALQWEHLVKHAYRWADAMLSERERTEHDAAPAARAQLPTGVHASEGHGSGGTDKPVARPVLGTGNQTAPPCVETDGSSPAIAQPPASSDGSGEGRPLDVTRPDNGEAAGGRGHSTQEPVAWAADIPGKWGAAPTMLFGYTKNLVKSIAAAGGGLVEPFPLYRTPQTCPYVVGRTTLHCSLTPFTLTALERVVLREARDSYADVDDVACNEIAAVLDGLLERAKKVGPAPAERPSAARVACRTGGAGPTK